jgi:SAM-dependent methyltransferase
MATADRKMRFGGLLENPYVSMIQRNILDYGRWQGLAKTLRPLELNTVLDIGCGLGENSKVNPKGYIGVDNSAPRISFAQKHFGISRFFYDLDRGAKFRSMDGMASLLGAHCGLIMEKTDIFVTLPGLYRHGVFLLRLA